MQTRPFVKWAGGKTQLLPVLTSFIPKKFNNYFEPFIGGGALFFALCEKIEKENKKAYINDINASLIGVYRNIKEYSNILIRDLHKLETEYLRKNAREREEFYYLIRKQYNNKELKDSDIKKTVYLLFLNKTGYNGMYRENSKGEFNIPFGKYENPRICDKDNIEATAELLKNTNILNTSFEKAVKDAKKEDFIYFDPPYYPLSKTASFTRYHENDFLDKEQKLLKNVIDDLTERGCYVILSNSNAPFIKELYKNKKYIQKTALASRFINSKASGRGKIEELIILNYVV